MDVHHIERIFDGLLGLYFDPGWFCPFDNLCNYHGEINPATPFLGGCGPGLVSEPDHPALAPRTTAVPELATPPPFADDRHAGQGDRAEVKSR